MSEKERNDWLREKLIKFFDSDAHKQKDIYEAAEVDRKIIPRMLAGSGTALGNAIRLIKFFSPKEEVRANLCRFVPELGDVLSEQLSNDYQLSARSLNELFREDPCCYEVFLYANREGGTTEAFVRDLLGKRGARALGLLIEEGTVIEKQDGVFATKVQDIACTDVETILAKQQHHLAAFDRQALIHDQIGSISHSTDYASLAGVKALRLFNGFVHSLFKRLIKLPWFKGDIPIFYQTLTGPINEHEASKMNLDEYGKLDVTLDEVKG